jgi:hypothetical protein
MLWGWIVTMLADYSSAEKVWRREFGRVGSSVAIIRKKALQ